MSKALMLKAIVLSAGLALTALPASSMARNYTASIEQSSWTLAKDTPVACQLEHRIPRYGAALFSSTASKDINMGFELDMLRMPAKATPVELRSVPPKWRPGVASSRITPLGFYKQFNGEVDNQNAWVMLNELEKGMQPTFYYQDWHNQRENIAVGVSSANFAPQYEQFLECMDRLLPYSFEDISYTTLNYRNNSIELDRNSSKKMEMIREYLKYEPELSLVLIDSYTDSVGGRYKNKQLSKQRAKELKAFFAQAGIASDRIATTGHGERRHIASNQTPYGRDANRRVVIRMNKD